MPSRTVVYGVGAATGIVVGAVIAQLSRATGRERLQRLLGRSTSTPATPTHIVLPDLQPALVTESPVGEAVLDGAPAPA